MTSQSKPSQSWAPLMDDLEFIIYIYMTYGGYMNQLNFITIHENMFSFLSLYASICSFFFSFLMNVLISMITLGGYVTRVNTFQNQCHLWEGMSPLSCYECISQWLTFQRRLVGWSLSTLLQVTLLRNYFHSPNPLIGATFLKIPYRVQAIKSFS